MFYLVVFIYAGIIANYDAINSSFAKKSTVPRFVYPKAIIRATLYY